MPPTPAKLAADKLAQSDLTMADAKLLGMVPLTPTQTAKLHPQNKLPSLKINYYTTKGKLRTDVHRVRLLADPPPGAFGEVAAKPLRYLQPPGSPSAAYFPRTVDWRKVINDPEITIMITEGEIKAATACKHGFKCFAVGGVWSWRSAAQGWTLLPELAEINWAGRDTVVVYDSDASTNLAVATATAALVSELTKRGAIPRVATLPAIPSISKTGLDDFIWHRGLEEFQLVVEAAEEDEMARELWKMNSRFVFIKSPGLIREVDGEVDHELSKFEKYIFGNIYADRHEGEKVVRKKVAPEWTAWEHRRQADKMTFAPGAPKFSPSGEYNTWGGWAVEPKKGSVAYWHKVLDLLFEPSDKEARDWFERWCYWPIKHPGTKQLTTAALWSREQGQGKSLVGNTLGAIYGERHYAEISQMNLESQFNGWAVDKQLVMVDDLSSHDSRSKADILKKTITQSRMVVNRKNIPTYTVPDCANYYLTSNRARAFFLDPGDRRYFIYEVKRPKREMVFYTAYYKWLRSVGASALLYYALNDLDYSDYNPCAEPPATAAKDEMIASVKSELHLWLTDLRDEPGPRLMLGKLKLNRDLWTPAEMIALFDQSRAGRPVAVNTMGGALRDYFPLAGGEPIKVDGRTDRYYVIRNLAKWSEATTKEMAAHVKKERAKETGGGKF